MTSADQAEIKRLRAENPRLRENVEILQAATVFVYVAFVVDVFAQRIVGWHAATTKHTVLVLSWS